ncbi:MAG: purine-nucleoside phosphorylase [Gemmatimonadaceae bacterium]
MTAAFTTGSFEAHSMGPGVAEAKRAADVIRARVRSQTGKPMATPVCAIVLGSGLGGLAARIENATRISFGDVPGFPTATVAGHAGQLIMGELGGRPVAALAGRLHLYEGHSASLAGFPVRVLSALGAKVYIASNAAGGVRRTLRPGDLMVINDHLNLMFRNPLSGPLEPGDERFPDMSAPYDTGLIHLLHAAARSIGVSLQDGVYCGLLGPTYETPAEIRMLEKLQVDAVGMSTVPEVIVARALGMRVAAVSCITNPAAGISLAPLNHQEVLDVGKQAAGAFEGLITEFVRRLD